MINNPQQIKCFLTMSCESLVIKISTATINRSWHESIPFVNTTGMYTMETCLFQISYKYAAATDHRMSMVNYTGCVNSENKVNSV